MKKIFTISIYILLPLISASVLVVLKDTTASAAFDSNNIIDNAVFDNSQTMSANDIQRFLNGFPNSCLKNYSAPYPISYSSYGESVSASTVIRRVADLWGINPQVVLATLEKEQSLVSGGVGCASWQYNSAMGMGCPDSGPCPAPQYAGFSQQVTKGSWQLMFNRQRSEGKTEWNGDGSVTYYSFMTAGYRARVQGGSASYYDGYTTIDGSTVYLSNGATASLYSYTPHFHGNQNFVLIFEKWFGTTHGTFLVQSPASPAVYLVNGSTRYGIPSYDILRAYGFDNVKVTPVSDSYMQSLADGGVLGTTFKLEGENAVYMADNGYRFGFATQGQCVDWGFPDCLNSKSLSPSLFNMVRPAGDMKSLMLNGSSVFLMQSGKKRLFLSGNAMTENGYSNANITPVTNSQNLGQSPGFSIPENNSLVSFGSTPVIYVYVNGLFYPINSYDVFSSLVSENNKVFPDHYSLYNSQAPSVQRTVPQFISLTSNSKTYMLGNGNKYDITATVSDWPTAQSFNELSTVMGRKATAGITDSNSTFQTPAGYLFRVSNKSVLPFYSVADFFSSPYTKQPMIISSDLINGLSTGNPILTAGGGSLFKVSTSGKQDVIYTLDNNGSSCAISTLDQLADFRFNTANVQRINEFMATGNVLRGLVKSADGKFYIIQSGTKTLVPANSQSSWGMNTSSVCTFANTFLDPFPTPQSNKTMKFARLPSGVIYYESGGTGHLIETYNTFLNLGGNSNNTIDVSADFLSYITLGQPVH